MHCGSECREWHKMLPACARSPRILRGMRWNIRLGLIWQRTQQWLSTTLRIIPYPNQSFLFSKVEYFGNKLLEADVCKWSLRSHDRCDLGIVLNSHNALRLIDELKRSPRDVDNKKFTGKSQEKFILKFCRGVFFKFEINSNNCPRLICIYGNGFIEILRLLILFPRLKIYKCLGFLNLCFAINIRDPYLLRHLDSFLFHFCGD